MSTNVYVMATLDACEKILARLAPIRDRTGLNASFSDVASAAYFKQINLTAQGFYIIPNEVVATIFLSRLVSLHYS